MDEGALEHVGATNGRPVSFPHCHPEQAERVEGSASPEKRTDSSASLRFAQNDISLDEGMIENSAGDH